MLQLYWLHDGGRRQMCLHITEPWPLTPNKIEKMIKAQYHRVAVPGRRFLLTRSFEQGFARVIAPDEPCIYSPATAGAFTVHCEDPYGGDDLSIALKIVKQSQKLHLLADPKAMRTLLAAQPRLAQRLIAAGNDTDRRNMLISGFKRGGLTSLMHPDAQVDMPSFAAPHQRVAQKDRPDPDPPPLQPTKDQAETLLRDSVARHISDLYDVFNLQMQGKSILCNMRISNQAIRPLLAQSGKHWLFIHPLGAANADYPTVWAGTAWPPDLSPTYQRAKDVGCLGLTLGERHVGFRTQADSEPQI